LIQEEFADVVAHHPALDQVLGFPREALRGAWYSPIRAVRGLAFLKSIGRGGWDIAIDCQGLARSGLFARASGARRRIGFADASEMGWVHFNDKIRTEAVHTVDRMMSLVDGLGVERVMDMRLYAPPDTESWWETHAKRSSGSYAVLAPRSRWPGKEWPREHWHALAGGLAGHGIEQVVLVGSPSEGESIDAMASVLSQDGVDALPLAGRTSVGQLMRVIQHASIVVANDSAPLHIAVGFNRPLVGIYGSTDPARVGPYDRDAWVVRPKNLLQGAHAYRDERVASAAMASIPVDEVESRVALALGGTG